MIKKIDISIFSVIFKSVMIISSNLAESAIVLVL